MVEADLKIFTGFGVMGFKVLSEIVYCRLLYGKD
jgi:hypothetical protein